MMTATNDTVLKRKQAPTPTLTMRTPASAGPTARAALTIELFKETALATRSVPTISGTKACRAGLSTPDWCSRRQEAPERGPERSHQRDPHATELNVLDLHFEPSLV